MHRHITGATIVTIALCCLRATAALGEGAVPGAGPDLFRASDYGELLPSPDPQVSLWWASSGWKVGRERPAPTRHGATLRVRVARNESEAAQIVVGPSRNLTGLYSQVGALHGPSGAVLPRSSAEVLRVRYLAVKQASDELGGVGEWPDPLPPFRGGIEVPAHHNQPLWLRVQVPENARPGLYRGIVTLCAQGFRADVPLEVEVYGFALPDTASCRTHFGFLFDYVTRYHNLKTEAQRRVVLDKYLRSFATHRLSPYDPAPLDNITCSYTPAGEGGPPVRFDWSAWDAAMSRALDRYHFSSFILPVEGISRPLNGHAVGTAEHRALLQAWCAGVREHLIQKRWLDKTVAYPADEPAARDYPLVLEQLRQLRELFPGLRRMVPMNLEAARTFIGAVDYWCPILDLHDRAFAAERQQAGDLYGWYICCSPKAPYIANFIDRPATDLRVWLWQAWQEGVQGVLIWQTVWWTSAAVYPDSPQNPYEDTMSWSHVLQDGKPRAWNAGDGRFLYPPEAATGRQSEAVLDGPVESIRWEALRDGMEDFEYLALLKRLLAARRPGLPVAEAAEYDKLLIVPASVSASLSSYTRDPRPIEARRDRIARAIERLSGPVR